MSDKTVIKIEFDNPAAAEHFASWLCGSGEQQYWNWMEYREEEEPGPITATHFDYHGGVDCACEGECTCEYGNFMCDNTIRTKCGRMFVEDFDEDEE